MRNSSHAFFCEVHPPGTSEKVVSFSEIRVLLEKYALLFKANLNEFEL